MILLAMKNIKHYTSLILLTLISFSVNAQQISIQPISKLSSNLDGVELITFSSEGEQMIGADKKGNIELWDVDNLKSVANIKAGGKIVMADFVKWQISLRMTKFLFSRKMEHLPIMIKH
jgi:WD40 repeat protein